ncbi:MAG TPA: hypothetical protein ENN69_08495, partial [Spirochaetia bacterium]|nr:hypothetical protein [Spirochaetia bacterium]
MTIRRSCGCSPEDLCAPEVSDSRVLIEPVTPDTLGRHIQQHIGSRFSTLSADECATLLWLPDNEATVRLHELVERRRGRVNTTVHALTEFHSIERDMLLFQRCIRSTVRDDRLREKAEALTIRLLLILQQQTERQIGFFEILHQGA